MRTWNPRAHPDDDEEASGNESDSSEDLVAFPMVNGHWSDEDPSDPYPYPFWD